VPYTTSRKTLKDRIFPRSALHSGKLGKNGCSPRAAARANSGGKANVTRLTTLEASARIAFLCATIHLMHTLRVRSRQREELVEFTDEVQRKLDEARAKEGVVVLYVQHTTAGLTVNENADPDVPRDMLHALR